MVLIDSMLFFIQIKLLKGLLIFSASNDFFTPTDFDKLESNLILIMFLLSHT